jgi:hypothetical protein
MKTKNELKSTAADIFKRYPKADRVFVTGDGQAFFNEADAGNHARRNRTGKELTLSKFLRHEPAESVPTVKVLTDVIASLPTVEAVEEIITEEAAYGNRKGVLDAAAKRITELTKPEGQ